MRPFKRINALVLVKVETAAILLFFNVSEIAAISYSAIGPKMKVSMAISLDLRKSEMQEI